MEPAVSSQYLALPPSCNLQSMLRSPAPDAPLMSEAALPAVTPRGRQAKNLAVEGVSSAQHANTANVRDALFSSVVQL